MNGADPYFRLERISKYLRTDIFPARIRESINLSTWKYSENSMEERVDNAYLKEYDDAGWKDFNLYDSWGGYDKVAWFRTEVILPDSWRGKTLAFRAIVGPRDGGGSTAETLLYINEKPVQALDVWHEEAFLDPAVYDGEEKLLIALKAWSGVLEVPRVRVFKEASLMVVDEAVDDFYITADTVLQCASLLAEGDLRRIRITKLLTDTFAMIDFLHYKDDLFYSSVKEANRYLHSGLDVLYQQEEIKPTVTGVGHSHIDMGWLWRYSATREKASRTFSTALNLMRQFPSYRFMHTSPQLYRFLEQDYPEIFAEVKSKIREGQWEITGGMWVEPDTNVPTGESLIRQLLLGKRYIKDNFGVESRLAWLPDVFGFNAALPQIFRKSDIDYFMTTKISWSQYTRFPHDTFLWKGIDGSTIFTHFITTPETGSRAYTYNGRMVPEEVTGIWNNYKDKDKNEELLLAFGWGDGGGGPTKEMIERAEVMKNIPGIPRVQIDTAENYFRRIYETIDHDSLGVWEGELYLEYHRGTYTSQAKTKRANREAEIMMHNIEFLSSYADILQGADQYMGDKINGMWERLLLNQFHDVLPGSSIRQVYEDTEQIYQCLRDEGKMLAEAALIRIADCYKVSETERIVINTTGWERSDALLLTYDDRVNAQTCFYDSEGQPLKSQATDEGALVWVEEIPAYGAKIIKLKDGGSADSNLRDESMHIGLDYLENRFLRVELNKSGQITSVYDKTEEREVGCGKPMNVFSAFQDKPQNFDAWDIDVYYRDKEYAAPVLIKSEIVSEGPIRAALRQTYSFASSEIQQDIILHTNKKRIDFKTRVDWKEKQVLLRVFFPVNIHSSQATYEIQCGNIERATHSNTEWDFAKFEVCAQKWVDISEEGYGVALLNDCKYGHDIHGNTIAMTLIKSAIYPDETADRTSHEFTYALYPHTGTVRQCDVQQEATALNIPLSAQAGRIAEADFEPCLEECSTLTRGLLASDCDHIVLDTIKRAEEERAYILRLYEYKNKRSGDVRIQFNLPVSRVVETNLIEREIGECSVTENMLRFSITPFEIKTFKIYL